MTADVPTTRAISDEMIEAAARAMCAFDEPDETASHWDQWHVAYTISARTALTAALPDLAQPSDEAVAQGDVLQTILWLASNRAKQVVWEQDRLVWEKVISLIHDELHRLAQSSGRGADHAREVGIVDGWCRTCERKVPPAAPVLDMTVHGFHDQQPVHYAHECETPGADEVTGR